MRSIVRSVFIAATLGACSTPETSVAIPEGSGVASIKPGMTQAQVGAILGDDQR
jgi:outer membrane protein assembly factor BamE (lipoprotein component of BamABCDE complex)